MPTYEYECPDCGHTFEIKQSFTDKPKKTCPSCKKRKLFKVLQVPHVFAKLATSEIKSIGHLANRNTEAMSKDRLAQLRAEDPANQLKEKAKSNAPWWRPGTTGPNRKVARMSKADQKKYIKGK